MHHGLSEKKFNNIDEVRSWVASYFDSQPTKFFDDGIQMIDGEALLIVVENIVWNKDLIFLKTSNIFREVLSIMRMHSTTKGKKIDSPARINTDIRT
ncbi:hypothetical protein RB195_012849 [Necator americanus]|uniref:SAM domain-containing protein n=1 Tax=Necator americanus TaxID=51031 RepID=A0ABR1DSZ3_NECAM